MYMLYIYIYIHNFTNITLPTGSYIQGTSSVYITHIMYPST